MSLKDLTGPITQLAIAWSEGDRESGELLFRSILRYLRPAAGRYALMCADHSTTDVLDSAYEQLCKDNPRKFESRQRFVGAYIQAMKYWLADYRRYWKAKKRNGLLIGTVSKIGAEPEEGVRTLLIDLEAALDRLQKHDLIKPSEAELFVCHNIMGVSQIDLADQFGIVRQTVAKRIKFVATLLKKELADYSDSCG